MVIGIVVLILWSLGGTLGMLIMMIDLANQQVAGNYPKKVSKIKKIFIIILSGPVIWIITTINFFSNIPIKLENK